MIFIIFSGASGEPGTLIDNVSLSPVSAAAPEPCTLLLVGFALAGLAALGGCPGIRGARGGAKRL
jgi:hypothetical protein